MEQLIEILEFFRNNNCEVEIYDCTYVTYDIWSNISNRWILQNANEAQLIGFYNKVK
jgi:hypothetical protein